MLKQQLVPALLLVVPATAALSASTGIAQAVEECRLEPGLEAPPGSKWNYRVNRDHQRCWFLSSGAVRGHHTESPRVVSVGKHHHTASTAALGQDQRSATDLETTSPPGKTVIAVADESFAVPQATTPSIEQSSNLIPRSVPTIAYRTLSTTPNAVLAPTVGAARVAERAPASATNTNLALLAGAAAALLVAGGTFHFTRQRRPNYAGHQTGRGFEPTIEPL